MSRTIRIVAILASALALLSADKTPRSFNIARYRVLNFDMQIIKRGEGPLPLLRADKGFALTKIVTHPSPVSALRIHIIFTTSDPENHWTIEATDSSGDTNEVIDPSAPRDKTGGTWTDLIAGSSVTIRVKSSALGSLTIDQYAYATQPSYLESIYGSDDRVSIRNAPAKWQKLSPAVARLRFMLVQGQATCTAFLFASDLVMTNNHCIRSQEDLDSAVLDFDYDARASKLQSLRRLKLEYTDYALDVSMLRLSHAMSDRKPLVLLDANQLADGAALAVIEHGGGQPKQLSLTDCKVKGTQLKGQGESVVDFGHTCDTAGGSSGSPVFDSNSGKVVGLHHFGFDDYDPNPVNQAVYVNQILQAIPATIRHQLVAEGLQ